MARKDQQPTSDSPLPESEATVANQEPGPVGEAGANEEHAAEAPPVTEELSSEALQEQLAQQRRQAEEYLDHLQRLQAEFQNYRRRVSQEQLQAASRGKEGVLRALVPILGNFRLALQHADEDAHAVRQGVQMIWQQVEGFLHDQGVERIETVGQPFDPMKHEALSTAPAGGDTPPDTIVAEINAGYMVDGRLLCPAQVVVARSEEPSDAAAASETSETESPSTPLDIEV